MENLDPLKAPLSDASILTKAFLRAGQALSLSQKEMATLLGVSEASMSRVGSLRTQLSPQAKEGEVALTFLRLFRSLDALFGGREDDMRKWFNAQNHFLNGTPRTLVQKLQGLFHVVGYLDAMRGKV